MKRSATILVLLAAIAALPANAQRRGATGPANPFANDAGAAQQGGTLYNQNCTSCHGPSGVAGKVGPALVHGEGPDPNQSDSQIFNLIHNGVNGTLMPAFAGKLSDDDIWKMSAYLRGLRGLAINNPAPGNVVHGEDVFWNKGQCGSCHTINGRGTAMGPDLSNVAGMRKTASIVDALTKPLHHIYGSGGAHLTMLPTMDTYPLVHVTTRDGKVVSGVLMNQDNFSVELMGDDKELHMFDRAKVRRVDISSRSAMPTDYDKRLAPDEFTDLIAFLTRQGKRPVPAAAGGRGGAVPPSD